jgi:aryl-alcohol dehydrogenase-like predicted oxidoreductase
MSEFKEYEDFDALGLADLVRHSEVKPEELLEAAIAWLMAQPGITAPIASATSLPQLEELFAATRLQLDAAQLEQLDAASR